MSAETESPPQVNNFVTAKLPWLLGAVMLIVFLATLTHWITPVNLTEVTDFSNWTERPHSLDSVAFLVTYPIRWLPSRVIPLALNLFSAICATLVLILLARSVSLLPHDRTHAQRQREHSAFSILTRQFPWVPPAFAVLVCGLQMTFWEHATVATSEMFNLLMFAYVIRCLLEYRVSKKESWLIRFAIVYGLGMADNWAMIGFLPVFAIAVVWIKGAGALNPRFIFSMICCTAAGFAFIIVTPLIAKISDPFHPPFWQTLRYILGNAKNIMHIFPRETLAVLCLTSVLPVFIMGIRWSSYFGDSSRLGVLLAAGMFHVVHVFFLLACLWAALDSNISARQLNSSVPLMSIYHIHGLTFYYLGALSVGYFIGYFFLVFSTKKSRRPQQPTTRLLNICVTAIVWVLVIAFPLVLVRKNFPHVQSTKVVVRAYEDFFTQMEQSLPPKGAVILSDDTFLTFFLQATLARHGERSSYLVVDVTELRSIPDYLGFLEKANPGFHLSGPWTNIPPSAPSALADIQLLDHLSLDHPLCYLHASFGDYFEKFYLEPHGLVYYLKSFASNTWDVPLPTTAQISENQAFWKKTFDDVLPPLLGLLEKPLNRSNPTLWYRFLDKLHLKEERDWLALPLGGYYAHPLDFWGVELQKSGLLAEAAKKFDETERLNANNVSARYNKKLNAMLVAKEPLQVQVSKDLEGRAFAPFGGWSGILRMQGPIDEPTFRNDLGNMFAKVKNYRQAIEEFDRVKALVPEDLRTDLELAQVYIYVQTYTNSLAQLLPWNEGYAKAVEHADVVLKSFPDQSDALFMKSVALIQMKSYDQALVSLNKLLAEPQQTNNYLAMLNRAIAYYKVGNLKAAKPDYEEVGQAYPQMYQVYFGLGQIAEHDGKTSDAIHNYELYLTKAPSNTEEAQFVSNRLKALKGGP